LSLEAIIAKIAGDAEARAAEIESAARAKAAEILAEAEKRARNAEERILKAGEREAEATGERLTSQAELGARKAALAARQQLLDEVFAAALEELTKLEKDSWRKVFRHLVSQTRLEGRYEVITSRREAAFLDDGFLKSVKGPELVPAGETREPGGGFVLRQGKTELNFTFPALTRSLRPRLERELLGLLGIEG